MRELPNDLIPLPTAPYSERPISLPLDVEECRTALWKCEGNISEAAKLLKVTSLRLRTFVNKSPYLSAELQEAKDQLVDMAEANVVDALTDAEDKGRRDTMSRYVLSSLGKERGWGTAAKPNTLNIKNTSGGTIIVQWADGQQFSGEGESEGDSIQDDSPLIEGESQRNQPNTDEGEAA